jgi:putative two-component system response regulator
VYKDAYPKDEAFRMIMNGECGVFSPKLLAAFQNVRKEFEDLTNVQKGITF